MNYTEIFKLAADKNKNSLANDLGVILGAASLPISAYGLYHAHQTSKGLQHMLNAMSNIANATAKQNSFARRVGASVAEDAIKTVSHPVFQGIGEVAGNKVKDILKKILK